MKVDCFSFLSDVNDDPSLTIVKPLFQTWKWVVRSFFLSKRNDRFEKNVTKNDRFLKRLTTLRVTCSGGLFEPYGFSFGVGWLVCDTRSPDHQHTCPQPLTGLVSRLVFTGLIPALFTNLWLWPPEGCRRTEGRLSTTLHANNKKEDWIGLIQVDDDEER